MSAVPFSSFPNCICAFFVAECRRGLFVNALQDKVELFETMPVPKAVLKLAIPTILSSLVMVIYNMADTYFVGMLNNSVQNAAVTLSAPVLLAFNAVNNLFGVGSSSMMSRALGRKDYDTVKRSSAFGFYCALFFALFFSFMCLVFNDELLVMLGCDVSTTEATRGYLRWTVIFGAPPAILNVVMAYLVRSEGSAMHASIGTMSGCLLNIVLDPIFILPWGFGMGAEGAGLATFISNVFACLYFFTLLFVRRGNTFVSVNPVYFTLRRFIVLGVCAVGIPASIQNLLNVTGMTILNNFTSSYGADCVAAMGIAQRLNQVVTQVAMGSGQGIMPLISYNYASGNSRRMKDALFFTAKCELALVAVMVMIYYPWAEVLVGFFMKNSIIIDYGAAFLRGFCIAIPFLCTDFLAVGVFQAIGMGKYSLIFAVTRKILLEIPALFILNRLFPLYGLAYAQLCAEVVLAAAAVFELGRIFRRIDRKRTAAEKA